MINGVTSEPTAPFSPPREKQQGQTALGEAATIRAAEGTCALPGDA